MKRRPSHGPSSQIARVTLALFWILVLALSFFASGARVHETGPSEAHEVVGPRECAECHEAENRTWLETTHHTSFKTLSRTPEARAIGKALGIRRVKREERCIQCHFTEQVDASDRLKVIAGVSCESCHGAAARWIDPHGDFGADGADNETPEHRNARLRESMQFGMRGPHNLAELSDRCLDCHLIADSELIDAGHPMGADYELLSASQGKIRHNFVRGAGTNAEATEARRRVLYWTGQLLESARILAVLDDPITNEALRTDLTARLNSAAERLTQAEDAPWVDHLHALSGWEKLEGSEREALLKELRACADAVSTSTGVLPAFEDEAK